MTETTYTITPETPVGVKLRIAADLITNTRRQLVERETISDNPPTFYRINEELVGLCKFLEDTAENPKNNEEYTKTLTDAATALRAVLRFW